MYVFSFIFYRLDENNFVVYTYHFIFLGSFCFVVRVNLFSANLGHSISSYINRIHTIRLLEMLTSDHEKGIFMQQLTKNKNVQNIPPKYLAIALLICWEPPSNFRSWNKINSMSEIFIRYENSLFIIYNTIFDDFKKIVCNQNLANKNASLI